MPTKTAASGTRRETTSVTKLGKQIFSRLDTVRSCCMGMARSAFVVSNFIMGGCRMGTSAMYV